MCMAGAFINDWCSDTWLTHGHNIDHGIKEHKNHANETKKAKRKAVKSCIEFILTKICQINGSHDISVHLSNRTLKCSCDLFVIKNANTRQILMMTGRSRWTNKLHNVCVCVCVCVWYVQPTGSEWPNSTPRCTGSQGDTRRQWWHGGHQGPCASPAPALPGNQGRAPSTMNDEETCWMSWGSPCPEYTQTHTHTININTMYQQTHHRRQLCTDLRKHFNPWLCLFFIAHWFPCIYPTVWNYGYWYFPTRLNQVVLL